MFGYKLPRGPKDVEFVFAIEKGEQQVRFMEEHFGTKKIFKDMSCIYEGGGEVWNTENSGPPVRSAELPDCDIFIAGFECDSISSLNHSASSNRGCGEDGTEKTGLTLDAVLVYMEKRQPANGIFEIVKSCTVKPKDGKLSVPSCVG